MERSNEYWRIFRGEKVKKSVIEWENPLGMDNINKMIEAGTIIGQIVFDTTGKLDTLYFMKEKNET